MNRNKHKKTKDAKSVKVYRLLRLIAQKAITCHIEFEITNCCNGRCVFCPRNDPRPKGFIDLETIIAGVHLAKAAGIINFKIGGFGEPILHPELISFLKYIKSEIPNSQIRLITTGELLYPELFEALAAIPIVRINLSFNGYDKASYESQMSGTDFDKVVTNLLYIAKFNNERIDIQFVPILSNSFGSIEMEKMKSFLGLIGFGGHSFRYHHIITSRSGKLGNEQLISDEFIEQMADMEIRDKTEVLCMANLSTLYTSWQGNIHLCCNDIHGEAIIGKIRDLKSLEDLRRTEELNVQYRFNYFFDLCRKCDTPITAPHEKIHGILKTRFT